MIISNIPNNRWNRPEEATLNLRDGQVLLGKVNKIYPNNRAEVQIGNHRFIAEIESPLAVGERYLFQVNLQRSDLVHLRVMGTSLGEMKSENIMSLLKQLNVNINDISVTFIKTLMKERVPFTPRELIEALQLLDRIGSSKNVQSMVKQMLHHKLPMNEEVLQALLSFNNRTISDAIRQTLQNLNNLPSSGPIVKLQSLLQNIVQPMTAENFSNLHEQTFRPILESIQLLYGQHLGQTADVIERLILGQSTQMEQTKEQFVQLLLKALEQQGRQPAFRESMEQIISQYKLLQPRADQLLAQFNLSQGRTSMTDTDFSRLKNVMEQELLPLLTHNDQRTVQRFLSENNSSNINMLRSLLQSFSSNPFYSLMMEILLASESNLEERTDGIQKQFLLHVQQLLQTLGNNHEAVLKQLPHQQEHMPANITNVQETIKSLLLQITQQDDRGSVEQIQQLLHFINGLQLQSKIEQNILQMHLQVPGKRLGLPKDLFVQFEGRKTKEDQLDTEFCRILFFLTLQHIDETIIDMNIQKRVITITVYNKYNDKLGNLAQSFKPTLQEGLNRLDYHLSNLRFKPLADEATEKQKPNSNQKELNKQHHQEGFDLFI